MPRFIELAREHRKRLAARESAPAAPRAARAVRRKRGRAR